MRGQVAMTIALRAPTRAVGESVAHVLLQVSLAGRLGWQSAFPRPTSPDARPTSRTTEPDLPDDQDLSRPPP